MINKKIAMSAFSIVASLAIMGGATFAFFTDTASSNGNKFTAGTLTFNINDSKNGTFTNTLNGAFTTPPGWAPGDTAYSAVCFQNTGSIPIQQILMRLTSSDFDDSDLAKYIYVSHIELGDVTGDASACQTTGILGDNSLFDFITEFNSRFTANRPLNDLIPLIDGTHVSNDDLLDGLTNKIDPAKIYKLRVQWTFNPSAPSTNVAGEQVNLNLGFTATQNEQP